MHGIMYDLDLDSGKLSHPRDFGVAQNATQQGGLGGMATHPDDRRLFAFDHALSTGEQSHLYKLTRRGDATQIGALKGVAEPPIATQGISGHFATFAPDGTLYGGADNGFAGRNATLMTIDIATGARTPKADNYNGLPVTDSTGPVTSLVFGAAFHPVDGQLYAWVHEANFDGATVWRVATLDTSTGLLGTRVDTNFAIAAGFLQDLEFLKKRNGQVVAYAVGNGVFRCDDITVASPQIEKVADFSGLVGTAPGAAERVTGLSRW